MAEATSLREMLAKAIPKTKTEIVIGKVTSVSPLEIQVINDAKLVVTDSNTYVPKHMTNYSVSIHISGSINGASIGTRTGTIYNGLKKDEMVYMLSYENGAMYFVLDRV